MPVSQILQIVKDLAIAAGVIFLLWKVYSAGEQHVEVVDSKVVEKQIQDISDQHAKDAKDNQDAIDSLRTSLADLQRVRNAPSPRPMSGTGAAPGGTQPKPPGQAGVCPVLPGDTRPRDDLWSGLLDLAYAGAIVSAVQRSDVQWAVKQNNR